MVNKYARFSDTQEYSLHKSYFQIRHIPNLLSFVSHCISAWIWMKCFLKIETISFQRKVDLRRHKETQHTDIRSLPQSQTASVRPPPVSNAVTTHPPHFMSALHRAHFLPPPPPLPGLPHLPVPQHPTTSLPLPIFSAPPNIVHDLSRPRGPASLTWEKQIVIRKMHGKKIILNEHLLPFDFKTVSLIILCKMDNFLASCKYQQHITGQVPS